MVQLAWRTPPAWVSRVAERPLALLADHAHCELRAAASARALALRHADRPRLVQALRAVEREELEHHALVVSELERRGAGAGPRRANPYAAGLLRHMSSRAAERLLDRLLVSALIEARSLERFLLLAEHLADRELAEFYASFVPAEAAHQALFLELARAEQPAQRVRERLDELRAAEAELARGLAFDYRMHSGPLGLD